MCVDGVARSSRARLHDDGLLLMIDDKTRSTDLSVLTYLLALKAEARSYCMMVTTWSRSVWYLDILSGDV
jgi:hypothetical protein